MLYRKDYAPLPSKIYFSNKKLVWYHVSPAAAAKSLQSCPTLCDPKDGSPPGSPVPEILQARTLEWVAISFSRTWKWKVKVKLLSRVQLLATPWTAAYQAPLSMGFSRQEYWSGVPLPSLASPARALPSHRQSRRHIERSWALFLPWIHQMYSYIRRNSLRKKSRNYLSDSE